MAKINFKGVGDPLPADTYSAVVEKAEYIAESKSSGNPTVAFTWIVNEGPYEGRKLFRSYSAQPNSLLFLKRVWIASGVDPDDLAADIETDDINASIIGNEVNLVVTIGEYNGEPNNQVTNVRPAGVTAF